ncbi:phage tail protein [Flavobacterium notoginsengisoli]|uniref:phage tail protein n=1 Tax=Flavobacterium notoginsengisoli TaxID=1478199 RepID=UPI00363523E0
MEGYLGEVRMFGGNFAPQGWMFCQGQSLGLNDYQALYVLLGTTFGGDGINNFNIPDLQGRIPLGTGTGPGLQNIVLGQIGGTESVTMSVNQMPGHTHVATAGSISIPTYNAPGNSASPTGNVLAGSDTAYTAEATDGTLKPVTSTVTIGGTGGSQPFNIIQPTLTTNYIICVMGIFPSRN